MNTFLKIMRGDGEKRSFTETIPLSGVVKIIYKHDACFEEAYNAAYANSSTKLTMQSIDAIVTDGNTTVIIDCDDINAYHVSQTGDTLTSILH